MWAHAEFSMGAQHQAIEGIELRAEKLAHTITEMDDHTHIAKDTATLNAKEISQTNSGLDKMLQYLWVENITIKAQI